MARGNFRVEQGIEILESNGTTGIMLLQGAGAPSGTSGPTADATIGSVYFRNDGAGEVYHKIADTDSASDYERLVDESVYTLLGVAFDAEDLGLFSGDIISDNNDVKSALQELETELVDTRDNTDDLISLSGVAENATDLGTFTEDIISDNNDVKGALQELETELKDTEDNVDDLITLSGVAENATDLGTFTGEIISDNNDVKGALQEIETAVENIAGGSFVSVDIAAATPTTVSTCLVDECNGVEFEVWVFEQADESKREYFKLSALHNGTSTADATDFDETVHTKLKVADVSGLSFGTKLTGTLTAQTIGLEISATNAITVKVRRTDIPS